MKPPTRAAMAAQSIRQLITDELQAGDKLPSEAEFARRLGVSRVTVRDALSHLWTSGIVTRRWGVGTFVRERPDAADNIVTGIYVDIVDVGSLPRKIEAAGHTPGLAHAAVTTIDSPDDVAADLGLRPSEPVWRIERCLTIDGTPAILLCDHIPLRLNGIDFPAQRLRDIGVDVPSLIQGTGLRVVRDEAKLDAVTIDPWIADQLRLDTGAPVIHSHQTSHADTGQIVVSSHCYYRSDVFATVLVRTVSS